MTLAKLEKFLLLLTLLLLPTQLGRHFWPQFSFVYSLPIDYLSPTLYFWDILVVFLMGVWIVNKGHVNKTALNLLLIFILFQAISLMGTAEIGPGLVRLEQYLIAGFFGLYLASVNLDQYKSLVFWALGAAIIGESLLALAQFIKGGTLGLWILGERSFSLSTPGIAKFDFYGLEFLRPYATFPHPNVLAGFMVISTVILSVTKDLPRMRADMRQRSFTLFKMTLLATSFLAGLTILLTVSRSAIISGLISAYVLLKKRGRILLLVAVLLLLPILYTRFAAVFNFDALTLIRREEQAVIAWKLFWEHPLSGVGLNSFIPAASDQLLAGPSRFLQPVHNIFLLSLAETGVIGMMGLISLIGYPVYRFLKLYPRPYPLNPLLLAWGVILFLGLFDHYFLTLPQGYRLLFLIWGISLSTDSFFEEKRENS